MANLEKPALVACALIQWDSGPIMVVMQNNGFLAIVDNSANNAGQVYLVPGYNWDFETEMTVAAVAGAAGKARHIPSVAALFSAVDGSQKNCGWSVVPYASQPAAVQALNPDHKNALVIVGVTATGAAPPVVAIGRVPFSVSVQEIPPTTPLELLPKE